LEAIIAIAIFVVFGIAGKILGKRTRSGARPPHTRTYRSWWARRLRVAPERRPDGKPVVEEGADVGGKPLPEIVSGAGPETAAARGKGGSTSDAAATTEIASRRPFAFLPGRTEMARMIAFAEIIQRPVPGGFRNRSRFSLTGRVFGVSLPAVMRTRSRVGEAADADEERKG